MKRILTILILGALVWYGYGKYQNEKLKAAGEHASETKDQLSAGNSRTTPASSSSAFRCDGRTHCSQMTSCEEAEYFLRHCPGVEMDGNNDGEPCEKQWCGNHR